MPSWVQGYRRLMSWSMDQLPALDLSQHLLSGKDLQTICHKTCLSLKVLFGMALRQATGFVEILLRLVRLDWTVPDFSALSPRQTTLAVNIPSRGSKGPLHLLIDSWPAAGFVGTKIGSRPRDRRLQMTKRKFHRAFRRCPSSLRRKNSCRKRVLTGRSRVYRSFPPCSRQ